MPRGTDGEENAAATTHYEIPEERLPEGFVDTVLKVPEVPAVPKPSATVVVLRDGGGDAEAGTGGAGRVTRAPGNARGSAAGRGPGPPEVLLLRRNRAMGFVPGAWVFPGGRVDGADGEAALADRWVGLTPEDAAARLGLPIDAEPPAIAYYGAAMREAFEETGLLAGAVGSGMAAAGTGADPNAAATGPSAAAPDRTIGVEMTRHVNADVDSIRVGICDSRAGVTGSRPGSASETGVPQSASVPDAVVRPPVGNAGVYTSVDAPAPSSAAWSSAAMFPRSSESVFL